MRAGPAITVFLAAAAVLAAEQADLLFSPTLPTGVSDVSSWEIVSGSFDTPEMRGSYLFYVNPQRQGIFQLMRYRTSAPDGVDRRLGAERVAFVRHPGAVEPMLCWQRQTAAPGWRLLVPDTPEYRAEMRTLGRVIALQGAVRRGR